MAVTRTKPQGITETLRREHGLLHDEESRTDRCPFCLADALDASANRTEAKVRAGAFEYDLRLAGKLMTGAARRHAKAQAIREGRLTVTLIIRDPSGVVFEFAPEA